MIGSDSLVLSKYGGSLKDVALVAQAIDHGLRELETVVNSVENLMPSEENQPQALEAMKSVNQEVKQMEEATSMMLVQLREMLLAGQHEVEKARETNKTIEEGLIQIENSLEKFGYDGSKMPPFIPPNPDEEHSESKPVEDVEFSDDEQSITPSDTCDSPTLSKENVTAHRSRVETMLGAELTPLVLSSKLVTVSETSSITQSDSCDSPILSSLARTPAHRSRVETMLGAEITPLVLSSKLLTVSGTKSTPKVRVSPNNPYIVKSSSQTSDLKKLCDLQKPCDLVRPVRPVLSTTYM